MKTKMYIPAVKIWTLIATLCAVNGLGTWICDVAKRESDKLAQIACEQINED